MIKHNKSINENKVCNNFLELELQKEKTKQLEIIRDIRKLELKLKLNKNYQRNNKKSFDVYKMLNSLSTDKDSDSDSDNNSEKDSDIDSDSNSDSDDNSSDKDSDIDSDDSLINDTISMYSVKSIDNYNEVDTVSYN